MLSLFPQILFLGPAGTTLLRVSAGLVYIYWAHVYWTRNKEIAAEKFPVIGPIAPWLVIVGAIASAIVGVCLVLGMYTQLAAIFGALGAIKALIIGKNHPRVFPMGPSANTLLLVICLSLIVSGAGAFAFDLPL